ncbi:MAG: MltA domain-containing protein [Aquabacterium sp.]|nr:MltA domain-containing protein [Aquabacterium sp.]
MQVQGTGRIRLPDGSILRLAYADQNGHPFKPMQLASSGNERVQTRGAKGEGGDLSDEVEHFDLADAADTAASADTNATTPPADEPLTRGARKAAASGAPADPSVADAVDSLLPPAGARPNTKPAVGKAAITLTAPSVASAKPQPAGGSQQLVDDLLTQAQKNARKSTPSPTAKVAGPAVVGKSGGGASASVVNKLSTSLLKQRSQALDSDPSYVFFRTAPDQSAQAGPVGALGVPLTAGRSLAVDPRVLPLGYPVFLDASAGDKRQTQMQRLMFAQDTGGAIRGAVRADYFWGFGADAGKQARRTKHRGRMWVLVPHAEVEALLSSKLVTRGGSGKGSDEQRECLIDDEAFCDASAVEDANSSR